MRFGVSADACGANFLCDARLQFPKTKGADPLGSAPSLLTVAGGFGGRLSDDLGSLGDDRDGDWSDQGEGGGDTSNLGHFLSLSVLCLVDDEMPRSSRSDADGESFFAIIFCIAVQTKTRTSWPRSAFSPASPLQEGKWRGDP